jgi:hypothetical protein
LPISEKTLVSPSISASFLKVVDRQLGFVMAGRLVAKLGFKAECAEVVAADDVAVEAEIIFDVEVIIVTLVEIEIEFEVIREPESRLYPDIACIVRRRCCRTGSKRGRRQRKHKHG